MISNYSNRLVEDKIEDFITRNVPNYSNFSIENKILIHSKMVRGCKSCRLNYETPYNPIPPIINKDSFAVFIGRNPNKVEAKNNELFPQGTAIGSLFDKYLSELNIQKSETSILNMAQCYCTGNRPPEQECLNKCVGFKNKEFELIGDKFKVIFLMGNDACHWLLPKNCDNVINQQGRTYILNSPRKILLLPIMHPSHLMVEPNYREDVKKVLTFYKDIVKELRKSNL